MFEKIIKQYREEGLFEKYSHKHYLYSVLLGEECLDRVITQKENATFIMNFIKTLYYMKDNLTENDNQWIVREYLSCDGQEYTDEEFMFRYSNVLIMCEIRVFNHSIIQCNLQRIFGTTVINFKLSSGENLRFFAGIIRSDISKIIEKNNAIELNVALNQKDIEQIEQMFNKIGGNLLPIKLPDIIQVLKKVNKINSYENTYDMCLLHVVSDSVEDISIQPIKGMLLNEYTGIFINHKIHQEYNYKSDVCRRIGGVLAFKYNRDFILHGDIRSILDDRYSFWAVNQFAQKRYGDLLPFRSSGEVTLNVGCYNMTSEKIFNECNTYIDWMLENYREKQSEIFTNKERRMLQAFILKNLLDEPELYTSFAIDIEELEENILKKYEVMISWIKKQYPQGHPFLRETFLFDAMSFSLAYCLYMVPKYLNNTKMMADMLEHKLVCEKDGFFDRKQFNESYSEFEIFFYLFIGIFCKSSRSDKFAYLEYEPDGNKNKRFEYAFVFSNYKINVEVKAIECDPEYADGINLMRMKDGETFYKNYFYAYDEKNVIPANILQNAVKLKSNYRQVAKNIKRIRNKCEKKENVINLGFLMINYGTSREEYISYLMHSEQGYLIRNSLGNIDALVLFSMCMDTDLMMTKVMEEEHLFVFKNSDANIDELLQDLRLNNYVINDKNNKYYSVFNDVYGIYKVIKTPNIMTIQRSDVEDEQIQQMSELIKNINENGRSLLKMSK